MYCKAKKNFGVIGKFLKIFIFENLLHKKRLKGGISIDADSGPPRYVLWCCGGICHQPDTLIKIGSRHTVQCHFISVGTNWLNNQMLCQFLTSGNLFLSICTSIPNVKHKAVKSLQQIGQALFIKKVHSFITFLWLSHLLTYLPT